MKILPVLDILNCEVVRGVAGKRQEYRPIQSRLTDSVEPLAVATALSKHFGFSEFYVADLDAILHRRAHTHLYSQLGRTGVELLVDSGICTCEDAAEIVSAGVARVVAGLETTANPIEIARLVERYGAKHIVFSLDLMEGRPLSGSGQWSHDPMQIAQTVFRSGVRQIIVLDLARVGTGAGVPTLELCRRIRREMDFHTIITGGGIRSAADLRLVAESGVDTALVASSLHDGSITPADLRAL